MSNKSLKGIFFLIGTALLSAVVMKGVYDRPDTDQSEEVFLRLKRNTGPTIRGFQYTNYYKGRKALRIKAAKFSVEKKKIGVFRLSPFKTARFRDAEIDFYGEADQPPNKRKKQRKQLDSKNSDPNPNHDTFFLSVLSQDMMPPAALKGSVSALCEPVKIRFYLNDTPVTTIKAEKAILEPRRRRMILRNNIHVKSGTLNLSTDQLAIYPEKGLFKVENKYVLKIQDETITGEKLTTDFFLKKVGLQ